MQDPIQTTTQASIAASQHKRLTDLEAVLRRMAEDALKVRALVQVLASDDEFDKSEAEVIDGHMEDVSGWLSDDISEVMATASEVNDQLDDWEDLNNLGPSPLPAYMSTGGAS